MTFDTTENRPAANGAAGSSAAGLNNTHSLPDAADFYPNIELWNLSDRELEVYEVGYLIGHADGAVAARRHIEHLSRENDRLYLRAYNSPTKIAEIQQRRLDGHFDREAERFFREAK